MADEIVAMIPKHKIYCEPFFGGGAVFFTKPASYLEVINDTNKNLIIFYRVMKRRFRKLKMAIEDTLHCESEYLRAKDIYNRRVEANELEIAWSVWVITNMSFSASMHGGWKWCNGSAGSHTGRFVRKKKYEFGILINRLEDVQISCRNALRIIRDRDTLETFYYLDPPYPGRSQGHYYGYTMKEFDSLLKVISKIKGNFILSNFQSQTLKWYCIKNGWNVKAKKIIMKVANFSGRRYKTELLVYNYSIQKNLFSELEYEFKNQNN